MRDIFEALRSYRLAADAIRKLQEEVENPRFLEELRVLTEAAELIRRDHEAIALAIQAAPIAEAVRVASSQAEALLTAIDQIGDFHRSPGFVDAAQAALSKLNVAMNVAATAEWAPEAEDISPSLGDIASANTDAERRAKVSALVKALVEGFTGVDFEADSAENKIRRIGKLIALLLTVLLFVAEQFESAQLRATVGETKTIVREQERTLAIVAGTLAQLRAELEDRPLPTYRVRQEARLRAAPDSSAPLLMRLKAGEFVRLRATDGRWRFVEVLTPTGEPSGLSGWVYQSVLRFER